MGENQSIFKKHFLPKTILEWATLTAVVIGGVGVVWQNHALSNANAKEIQEVKKQNNDRISRMERRIMGEIKENRKDIKDILKRVKTL